MPSLQFRPGEDAVAISPLALERLARFAADQCELRSVLAQGLDDPELLKETQNVHDLAEVLVHRLTGKNLPSSVLH